MRYEGRVFRPPSEADSLILQATIGCSWNHCTYCAMYRDKQYRTRPVEDVLADIESARTQLGADVRRVFVADGDALVMTMPEWRRILGALRLAFPRLQRVSSYATALNLKNKSVEELRELRQLGLRLLYVGPESGDELTLKKIAKGGSYQDHVSGAHKLHQADIQQSLIFLLGIAGVERGQEHARASAKLTTEMDPRYVSLLTVTVIPDTPLYQLHKKQRYAVPEVQELLSEVRTFVEEARPSNAVFRSNHASNYLPLAGRLPRDKDKLISVIDGALSGSVSLRAEWERGL